MWFRPCDAPRGGGALVIVSVLAGAPRDAVADPIEVGGFLGPRIFAGQASLGHIEGIDIALENTVAVGARVARPFFPWLVAEAELPIAATSTDEHDVDVFWMEPRAHVRLEPLHDRRVRPFVVTGVGIPVALSSKRGIFASGVSVDVYAGGGVHVSPGRGVNLRLDARAGLVPARGETVLTTEVEITVGLWVPIGGAAAARRAPPPPDRDRDGIIDSEDACVDRAEDHDGFEDRDGCPDIDNDADRVLDIADRCASVPESVNGFEDDDGCPDVMPRELDQIVGTIEGLLYRSGEIEIGPGADRGLARIVDLLAKFPSVKIVLIGHSDDQEALMPIEPEPGEAAPDPAALAAELSRARAGEVKRELVNRGVAPGRIQIAGKGAEEPVSEGNTPRVRMRNRRVEVRLFVPER